jgi:F-type H+-transporting ATPase subunit b
MQFDWWTFAFQVVNVLVLMWLLSRFMFRPVARIIAERRAETSRVLKAAEAAKRDAAAAEAAALAEKQKNAAERLAIIETAREEAEVQKKGILEQAEKAAAGIAQKSKAEAARQEEEGREARLRKATDLAVIIARRLLASLPDDARVTGYPERLRHALMALDAEQREALSADPGALRLVAPRALTDAEMAAATEAIQAAITFAPKPAVELDDTLIAGLELSGRHGVVHNSLKYDLGRIVEALEKHDKI